jgi:ATP-dependent RNA helicase HelY
VAGSPAAEFAERYPFDLDPFQVEAIEALARDESVLVAAPTGSGKTVVAEFAVWLALRGGGKAFYTTPLKALSNQKFGDLIALHGATSVGLLTGDNSINPHAPVVVMTTEVLRNMIYERSDLLADLHCVVLDEVHYLQDRYRGAVWEEVIIHLPASVKIVSLSATVSNAEEFADWIQTLRGATTAVIEERRPVSLEQHYLAGDSLLPMFTPSGAPDGELVPNPEIRRIEARAQKESRARHRGGDRRRGRGRRRIQRRSEVVELLEAKSMLPAIYFIFSRKGCNMAVVQVMREGIRLTDHTERVRIREHAEMRCSYLGDDDLEVLGYPEWVEALSCGVAAHHAGLIPVFKETVEELFQAGLVKAVFATETLSLGINMPARTVVIESLTKFGGERHEMLTPGQFTQLTGRAGRRGIDTVGHAVVLQQRDIPFNQIAGLASTRTYTLVSSFQPSYNMATNLVRNYDREEAEHLLNSSFAQYRADKDVVVFENVIERNEAYIASYREKAAGDQGRNEQWARRASRLARETERLRKQVRSRTETLSRRFERVLQVLEEYGYVKGFELTPKGWTLARIYNENDILVAETLARGWLGGLHPSEVAAVVSGFVFESRGPFEVAGAMPTAESGRVYEKVVRLGEEVQRAEQRVNLELTRGVEAGFAGVVYRWCSGAELEEVLDEDAAGDFIRGCKQTVDLLRQIREANDDLELDDALGKAISGVDRGVVAYTGMI